MIAAILLLQAAQAAPTVGDTIWLARTVPVPAGHTVRPPEDSLAGAVELLGPPRLVTRDGAVLIRYPAVAWEPGRHTVALPGPVLVAPDGVEDSVPPLEVAVTVRSVLPAVPEDSVLPVQAPTGLVLRQETSLLPVAALLALGALLLAPLHWWWRRRGPRVPGDLPLAERHAVPLRLWADAGERRAVLAAAAALVRTRLTTLVPEAQPGLDTTELLTVLAAHRPDLPLADIESVLRELDAGRFAPGTVADPAALAERAAALAGRLGDAAPAATHEPAEAAP